MHQNSLDVYYQIRDSGLLSKTRQLAYEILVKHGPSTANQIGVLARTLYGDKTPRHNYYARCAELWEQQCVDDTGTIACPVNGNNATRWAVNGKIPIPFVRFKRPTRFQFTQAFVALEALFEARPDLFNPQLHYVLLWLRKLAFKHQKHGGIRP